MNTLKTHQKQDGVDEQADIDFTNEWDRLIDDLESARQKINEIIK